MTLSPRVLRAQKIISASKDADVPHLKKMLRAAQDLSPSERKMIQKMIVGRENGLHFGLW